MEFIQANSANFTPGRTWNGKNYTIQGIVIHSMDASMNSCINTFKAGSQKSAHYLIGLDGRVVQMVRDEDTAWAAGRWEPDAQNFFANLNTINIEHEDNAQPQMIRSDALYEASSQQVARLCQQYNIPCNRNFIKKHSEVSKTGTQCPAGLDIDRIINRAVQILTPAQSQATVISVPSNIDPDVINAGTVIKQALPVIHQLNGSPFGNAEGAARYMVGTWENMITNQKKAKSILQNALDQLTQLFGV